MEISYIYNQIFSNFTPYTSLVVKFRSSKDIWLFNCIEGCQHYLMQAKIKMSQISTIVITDLKSCHISGLMGLLSSLSLGNRQKDIYIYAPIGAEKYLQLIKKYSKTNFKYNLFIVLLHTGIIINSQTKVIYVFLNCFNKLSYHFIILNLEKQMKFNVAKANDYKLLPGPLYGKLKQCSNFILPDGLILNGDEFVEYKKSGNKFAIVLSKYHTRTLKQIMNKATICFINKRHDIFY